MMNLFSYMLALIITLLDVLTSLKTLSEVSSSISLAKHLFIMRLE